MNKDIGSQMIKRLRRDAVRINNCKHSISDLESKLTRYQTQYAMLNKLMNQHGIDEIELGSQVYIDDEYISKAVPVYQRVLLFVKKTGNTIEELNQLAQEQQRKLTNAEAAREDFQRRLEAILEIMVERDIASGAFEPVDALIKFKDNYNKACSQRDEINDKYNAIVKACMNMGAGDSTRVLYWLEGLWRQVKNLDAERQEVISYLARLQPDLGTPDGAVELNEFVEYYFRRMQTLLVDQGVIKTKLTEMLDSANVPTHPSIVTRIDALIHQNRESMKLITEQRMKLKNIEDYISENNPNDKLRKASDSLLDRLKKTVTQVAIKQVEQSEGGYFETRAIIKKHLPDQQNLPINIIFKGLIRDLEAYQMGANFTKPADSGLQIGSGFAAYNLYGDKRPDEMSTNVEVLVKTRFDQYITLVSDHCQVEEKGYIRLIPSEKVDPDEYEIIGWRYANE